MFLTSPEARELQWRKASRSAGNGACVEVAPVNGQIAVRDSMNPGGGQQQYSVRVWQAFISAVKRDCTFE
jgi:hypothetical protein